MWGIGAIIDSPKRSDADDFYKILGCTENSTEDQITAEYRVRALKCHPDKNPGNESVLQEFQRLQEARDTLTDPEKRQIYNRWKRSEVCIPYKQWKSMNSRCMTTMHWAEPRDQTMLENSPVTSTRHMKDGNGQTVSAPPDVSNDRGNRERWESEGHSDSTVYSQFRNYKI